MSQIAYQIVEDWEKKYKTRGFTNLSYVISKLIEAIPDFDKEDNFVKAFSLYSHFRYILAETPSYNQARCHDIDNPLPSQSEQALSASQSDGQQPSLSERFYLSFLQFQSYLKSLEDKYKDDREMLSKLPLTCLYLRK
jgi:hypothetical protein